MCLAVPGKVVTIEQKKNGPRMGRVDFAGIVKDVCLDWVPEAKAGDYVIVHAGFALNILNEEEAQETLKLLREMAELGERDNNNQDFH